MDFAITDNEINYHDDIKIVSEQEAELARSQNGVVSLVGSMITKKWITKVLSHIIHTVKTNYKHQ